MSCRLYTVGHSVRPLDELVRVLREQSVDMLCDVRRFPRSRRHPHFSRAALERELPGRGIDYRWLGEDLGGFRDTGFEAWMRTSEFERGLTTLEDLASDHAVAFMCSEADPAKCHRLHVARALAGRGHRVEHLRYDGPPVAEPSPLTPPGP